MLDLDPAFSAPQADVPDKRAWTGGFREFLTGHTRDATASPSVRQGAWTVLDHTLFSGSTFAVSALVALWRAPEAFGAFTTAFCVFLGCRMLHAGLLVEPMLVFKSGRFERRRRAYLRLRRAAGPRRLRAARPLA